MELLWQSAWVKAKFPLMPFHARLLMAQEVPFSFTVSYLQSSNHDFWEIWIKRNICFLMGFKWTIN